MKRITLLFTLMLLAFSTQGWAESRNGSDFQEGDNWYLMLEDFEGDAPTMGTTKDGRFQIMEESGNKFMNYGFKAYAIISNSSAITHQLRHLDQVLIHSQKILHQQKTC